MAPKHFRKRDAILQQLRKSKEHPSAETLFKQLKAEIPDLSMGTVYRNLNLFKEQGLAISVATVKGVERFDGNTGAHVHFICDDCSAVIDLESMEIPQALCDAAAQAGGVAVTGCNLSFNGICRACRNKQVTA